MTLSADGWFDWAERMPAPENKLWEDHDYEGLVFHSAVGTAETTIGIVLGQQETNERSVTGLIRFDGSLVQFYAMNRSPWANGNKQANLRFKGFEFEGGGYWPNGTPNFSQPLTEAQKTSGARLLREALLDKGMPMILKQTAHEHNEFFATACPSGRMPWVELFDKAQAVVPASSWVIGDTSSGLQKVGRQTFIWNNGVMGNAIGNYDGTLPGTFYHLHGDRWLDPFNEDPEVDNS